MSNQTPDWQETHTIWNRITGAADQQLPDADITIMVYDGFLDNIVWATVDLNEDTNQAIWWDTQTDEPLPKPTWWAEIVFPEDI